MTSSSASCSICAESYGTDDICSTICGHIFHSNCLRLWLQRSNTCPLCNRNSPEPHRIYLDIKAIEENITENGGYEVVIKNVQPNLNDHLSTTVMALIHIMRVPIKEEDIGNISEIGNKLHVSFKAAHHRDLFVRNKNRLKGNPQTSEIRIHELLDAKTNELFSYSHKLKEIGYKIFYVKNNFVFVRKEKNTEEIQILSKGHVDILRAQEEPARSHVQQRNIEPMYGRQASVIARPIYRNTTTSRRRSQDGECTIL